MTGSIGNTRKRATEMNLRELEIGADLQEKIKTETDTVGRDRGKDRAMKGNDHLIRDIEDHPGKDLVVRGEEGSGGLMIGKEVDREIVGGIGSFSVPLEIRFVFVKVILVVNLIYGSLSILPINFFF